MGHFGYIEAGVIGVLQGVTELFPVSSLGHAVLLPAVIGGSWSRDLSVSAPNSPYLAFIVAIHVATALALIVYFRRDWARIIRGLLVSIRDRRIETVEARLAWLLILATIPVGIAGLALEHLLRTTLGRPVPAAAFLAVNGAVLLGGERLRRREDSRRAVSPAGRRRHAAGLPAPAGPVGEETIPMVIAPSTARPGPVLTSPAPRGSAVPENASSSGKDTNVIPSGSFRSVGQSGPFSATDGADAEARAADGRLAGLSVRDALIVGGAQIAALAPGISRSGSSLIGGLLRGLSHADAARFAFLLATPVILAAGLLKLPDLFGPLGDGVRGQTLVGAVLAGCASYLSVRVLSRWFETRTVTPFAIYCVIAGALCLLRFGLF
jgi:undecaprenyl-diphosphatase